LVWAGGWWIGGGFLEIVRHAAGDYALAVLLVFAAGTAAAAAVVAARADWPRLDWLGVAAWPLAAFCMSIVLIDSGHPAAAFGWLVWPVALLGMATWLRLRDARFPRLGAVLHAATFWLATALVALELRWL